MFVCLAVGFLPSSVPSMTWKEPLSGVFLLIHRCRQTIMMMIMNCADNSNDDGDADND